MRYLFWVFIFFFPVNLEAAFEKVPGLMQSDITFLALHPFNDNIIYVSSSNSLYKKESGQEWKLIYRMKQGAINFIYPDPSEYRLLFVATDLGLLLTRDGERFEYIFKDRSRDAKCYCLKREGTNIYLGTSSGLYRARMGLYDFKKVQTLPQDLEVYWIEYAKRFLYLASNRGVYRSKDFNSFEHTFIVPAQDKSEMQKSSNQEENQQLERDVPKVIVSDKKYPGRIYLGTEDGLFISNDFGQNFRRAYIRGLPKSRINFIAQDKGIPELLYIATNQGLFKVYPDRKTALEIYEGLPTSVINCLGIDSKGKLYLATARGLFVEGEDSRELLQKKFRLLCRNEPGFREVQEAALKYNEVSPEKIRAWRRALKYRAVMPSVSLGYDKTISYYHQNFWTGPRDWSLDFSWDLGNLLWNSYQDDVDTRARLNTQLRLDILEEVNRLYFERRRVKLELLNNKFKDSRAYIKKKMYLEELTAALDAYTGGYFSKRLKEIQRGNSSK